MEYVPSLISFSLNNDLKKKHVSSLTVVRSRVQRISELRCTPTEDLLEGAAPEQPELNVTKPYGYSTFEHRS